MLYLNICVIPKSQHHTHTHIYAPCMECLPTFGIMWVILVVHLGIFQSRSDWQLCNTNCDGISTFHQSELNCFYKFQRSGKVIVRKCCHGSRCLETMKSPKSFGYACELFKALPPALGHGNRKGLIYIYANAPYMKYLPTVTH